MDVSIQTQQQARPAQAPARPRLGEILLARGKLDAQELERILRLQASSARRERLGSLLVTMGVISARDLALALAEQSGMPFVESSAFPDIPILEEQISARFLRDVRALPIAEDAETLTLAVADPFDELIEHAFRLVSERRIVRMVAVGSEVDAAIERLYGGGRGTATDLDTAMVEARAEGEAIDADVQQLKDLASEAPVIRLVSVLINNALEARASDIHIEPFENRLVVRYRIDGVLHEVESPPKRMAPAIISRVKILANLDIAERRLPQDGRIRLRVQGKEIDLRISTVPTMHGESVVMRILDKGAVALNFSRLGFEPNVLAAFQRAISHPNGIVLVTGPTGSGKTTTLYTALDQLNKPDVKILTVEDPVEYQMPGINQIQVKPQIDLTFANALRAILRQDPDIIMIGEIRDLETAQIAVQAALTGHLVLSTLHTNDAPAAVTRLLDMGVEDYLLASTLVGVLAQRLVRTLCERCKAPQQLDPTLAEELGFARLLGPGQPANVYRAVGCRACAQTGYAGRLCIAEMMPLSEQLRRAIVRRAASSELRHQALAEGMVSMYDDGLRKVLAGVTTVEEVLRATREG
ncbi:MAG: type II secretion system ATPase GspE [Casimicrobiaceae bacterium]|nr:type II secretion system ATPase GspE [Casimicrobiaceae bacterium]MCX8097687.1 type II secretion system ATPase GspE [Casimicrobiaceae bacterium]MDW8312280.1 type II secretion system ATPase GspE [Burkholderiales bacterium]